MTWEHQAAGIHKTTFMQADKLPPQTEASCVEATVDGHIALFKQIKYTRYLMKDCQ
jgi:hypothetical protein